MSERAVPGADPGEALLAAYDTALPYVYGYLISRCGEPALAEDLTAETFLAAVDAVRRQPPAEVSSAWLVGIARHKLVDHWRRQAREDRNLRAVAEQTDQLDDPWDVQLDALRARNLLARLGPHHRTVLTLRYLDDLAVPDVAALMGRSLHATEALLTRARGALRRVYIEEEGRDD